MNNLVAHSGISVSAERSKSLANMSFVCAVLIVYLHTGCAAQNEIVLGFLHKAIVALCRVAIPWFFLASGFFLARRMGEDGWWYNAVTKRIRTLLIPFWIWGTAIFLVHVLIALLIKLFGYEYHGANELAWVSIGGVLRVVGLDYAGNMPTMWYMRTLFILVMLSPLISIAKSAAVIFFGSAYLLFSVLSSQVVEPWSYILEYLISLRGLLYFSLGIYIFSHQEVMGAIAKKILVGASGILFFIFNLLYGDGRGGVFDVLMVPGLIVIVYYVVKQTRIPTILTNFSFAIYVTHAMIAYCLSAIYGVIGVGGVGKTFFVFGLIRFIVALSLSMILTSVLRWACPRFAKLAFGGR